MAHPLPTLPPELWHRVFLHINDPCHLWITCRQVSSPWREAIPRVFAAKYLRYPYTLLFFECEETKVMETSCVMNVHMVFDRFQADDKSRCIFVPDPLITDYPQEWDDAMKQEYERTKWEEQWKPLVRHRYLHNSGVNTGQPSYSIRIKTRANDTEIPGLQCDVQKREVSFDWHGMFDNFYLEEAERRKQEKAWADNMKAALKAQLARANDASDFTLMKRSVNHTVVGFAHIQKSIRKHRMQRFHRQRYGHRSDSRWREIFNMREQDAINALHRFEADADVDCLDFSDDECGDRAARKDKRQIQKLEAMREAGDYSTEYDSDDESDQDSTDAEIENDSDESEWLT